MPHLSGVFDEFADLDKVPIDEISTWLNIKPEIHFLINFLGNRILYPQVVPLTSKDLEVDLAILRAAIKLKPSMVYEPQTNRILIPKLLSDRFPKIKDLVKVIIEGINPKGVHNIFRKSDKEYQLVGSVISPLSPQKLSKDERTVIFTGLAIQKALPLNAVSILDTPAPEAKINLGGEEYSAAGGEAGIFIDLRMGGFA